MGNPFTRFLRTEQAQSKNRELEQFVQLWDAVEAIVVDVNKRGDVTREEAAAYQEARTALLADYASVWQPSFAPHWPLTLEGGRPTPADPFLRILAALTAEDFVSNRPTMQALASARETVNRYIVSLKEEAGG